MKIAEIENGIDSLFTKLANGASPTTFAAVNAARGIASLGLGIAKETLRKLIESGGYADAINRLRDLAKTGVSKVLPSPFRWVPCVRPGKAVDRLADWLIEQETEIAKEVGAKSPATTGG